MTEGVSGVTKGRCDSRTLGGIGVCGRTSESGRSMVEMLGVLAIMGVLAVGGIAGYKYAMNKYRASDTIRELTMQAQVVATQRMRGQAMTLHEFGETTRLGYQNEVPLALGNTGFQLGISSVPTEVCEEIVRMSREWGIKRDIYVDKIIDPAIPEDCKTPEGKVLIEVAFANDLSAGEGIDGVQRCSADGVGDEACRIYKGYAYKCNRSTGMCEVQCASNATYLPQMDLCCRNDRIMANGGCCYQDLDEDGGCGGCPAGSVLSAGGVCKPCETSGAVLAPRYNSSYCLVCPNKRGSGQQCLDACPEGAVALHNLCRCPMDRPVPTTDGRCISCNECREVAASSGSNNCQGTWTSFYGFDPGNVYGVTALCNFYVYGGYSHPCKSGTVAVSWTSNFVKLCDGSLPESSVGYCLSCDKVRIGELPFQAMCESCGGTWDGTAYDKGTCKPPAGNCSGE